MTIPDEFVTAHQALINWSKAMPDREFLLQPVDGQLRVATFQEAEDQARRMAAALVELGLKRGDKIAILGKNSAEWMLADFAIAMAGMVSVPIYPTANTDTIAYVIGHSEAKAIFVGKLDNASAIGDAIPRTLPTIAFPYETFECQYSWQSLIDSAEALATIHEPANEDVMTILYTSGSTGRPKGVVISYGAYSYGCRAACERADLDSNSRALCYLMLAHVTERMAVIGPCIFAGARVYFVESLETFPHDLRVARPTAFASVPRLWTKFRSGVHASISPTKLRILLALPIVGRIVARKIRSQLGFEECTKFGSGTAPISLNTLKWYAKLDINIGEGWGMTETSGLSCSNLPFQARRLGTIGVPVDGTEMKISEEGELLIRGPGMFTEYLKEPELTKDVFTDDGFFRTGDKAEWDEGVAAFRITGRVKDIFKTAKGKYVVPVPIESRLSVNPLLEQICVVGSGRRAPIALVVLSEAARNLPRENVETSLEATLGETNKHLESHERLSNMLVVSDEWTSENELLTPTLKVKREQLEGHYSAAIDLEFRRPIAWESEL